MRFPALAFLTAVASPLAVVAANDTPSPTPPSAADRLGIVFAPPPPAPAEPALPWTNAAPPLPADLDGETVEAETPLPAVEATEPPLRFTAEELLTAEGRLEFAKDKYLSTTYRLTIGPLAQLALYYNNWLTVFGGWHPNDAEAITLYQDDLWRQRKERVDEIIARSVLLDPTQAAELKPLSRDFRTMRTAVPDYRY